MTKDEALKMALEALEDVQDMMTTSDWFNDRAQAVRQALDQSPDTTKMSDNLTKAKQYLTQGALVPIDMETTTLLLEALRQAIEQAEKQKPVVIPEGFSLVAVKGFDDLMYWLDRCERKGHLENCPDLLEPYEAFEYRIIDANPPPQREWIELTDEEIRRIACGDVECWSLSEAALFKSIARAIEAKLKEKNT